MLGIGDDAAVWQPSRSHRSVISTDALVEGVHFSAATMEPFDIGYRAMASNLSDLAAMAARPVLATVALGMPAGFSVDEILALYRGLLAAADSARTRIVGGDLTRSPALLLAVTVVGEVRASNLKRRGGARRGDVFAVTGELGASRAGLHLGESPSSLSGALRERALAAHRRPAARWREGLWLGASTSVHALMDISDGLSTDLARMAEASGTAARVEAVPVDPAAAAMARSRGEDPHAYALAGGEDYELLVAIEGRAFEHLCNRFHARFRRPLHRVGVACEGDGITLSLDGRESRLERTGWDHFA